MFAHKYTNAPHPTHTTAHPSYSPHTHTSTCLFLLTLRIMFCFLAPNNSNTTPIAVQASGRFETTMYSRHLFFLDATLLQIHKQTQAHKQTQTNTHRHTDTHRHTPKTGAHTHTHKYTQTYSQECTREHVHTLLHAQTITHTSAHTYENAHKNMQALPRTQHARAHTHTHTRPHTHTHTHTHTHIHTHTHTHTLTHTHTPPPSMGIAGSRVKQLIWCQICTCIQNLFKLQDQI